MSDWYTTSVLKRFSTFYVAPNERINIIDKIGFDIINPVFHCTFTTLNTVNLEWDSNVDIVREHPFYTFKTHPSIGVELTRIMILAVEGDRG
ncbi:MAG: hypothetical protein ACRC92_21780 [Peptostreptococcaceae bacterium]